jgi:eukaryotic-like serine/threonine-protein kinase
VGDTTIAPATVRTALEKVLASGVFQSTGRSGMLLRFLVEHAVDGHGDQLKEYTLGAEALGRGEAFDPRTDSIARVEASRLRSRLELYYAAEGRTDPVWIVLPKGTYVPQFVHPPVNERDGTPQRTPRSNIFWRIAAAAGLAIALAATWAPWRASAPLPPPVIRLDADLGAGVSLRSSQVGSASVIVSPDGRRLVFISFGQDSVPRLMTRLLDQAGGSEAAELPGTEGVRGPFFSPDGQWVAFWARGKLWKIQVQGGTPIALCDTAELLGGSWGDDDFIVAALSATGLSRIPSRGGAPVPIGGLERTSAQWPEVLPGSKSVLFSSGMRDSGREGISVLSLVDRRVKILIKGGTYGRYLSSGHLAYLDQGTLFVVPFDAARAEVTGMRSAVLNDVSFAPGFGSAEFDVSRTGALVYRRRAGGSNSILQWLDSSGGASTLLDAPAAYLWPRISPDGSRLVFSRGEGGQQSLWIYEWRSGKLTQATPGSDVYSGLVWTPDGRFLITSGSGGMRWLSSDGAADPQKLALSADVQIPWSFDRVGSRLAFYQRGLGPAGSVTFDLWTVPIKIDRDSVTAGKPEPFLVSDAFEMYPAFSPDGRWIAYTSLESGAYEVYVRTFPDSGRRWQVSNRGGSIARWARDGRRLFYRTNEHRITVVDYSTKDGIFHTGPPRLWLNTPIADTGVLPNFDVAPDGRIAALMPVPQAAAQQDERHVTLILNFLDEVRRRAPE